VVSPVRVVDVAQRAAELDPNLGVERAERLVQQQHFGIDGERARKRDALALPARQLRREPAFQLLELNSFRSSRTRSSISRRDGRLRRDAP